MVQVVYSVIIVIVLAIATVLLYKARKNETSEMQKYEVLNMDVLLEGVKVRMAELIKDDDIVLANDQRFEAVITTKRLAEKALTGAIYGIDADKKTVEGYIRSYVETECPTMEALCEVIDFTDLVTLQPMVKFEILLYKLTKRLNNKKAIQYLEKRYEISVCRMVDDGYTKSPRRCLDYKKLDAIFAIEVESEGVSYSEALDIVSILLFQKYKGFGCIDTLRALDIDGMHFGTSGSIRYLIEGNYDIPYRATNSVWVQIDGKWVHFSFLDFYTTGEMRRVCNQLVSWGTPSPMNEKHSYKVSEMYDGTRVTAMGPPTGECFACHLRKFVCNAYTKEELLNKPNISNWEIVADLTKFLMKAKETTAFTGAQNMGKTSFMKAVIGDILDTPIRILEMSFELAIRELYPDIDCYTMKPSEYVSAAVLQDTQKKMDSGLSMVGEVAEDIVAARMIQYTLVGTDFTIFSHHGKDDVGLIYGLANSLVASGEYHDHNVAISTVLDAIKHNVHLGMKNDTRVVEYISEIVKEETIKPYPDLKELLKLAKENTGDNSDLVAKAILAYTSLAREYFTRTTDRIKFTSRKIIYFDEQSSSYVANEWYTPATTERILKKLNPQDRVEFMQFYEKNWGCK